MADRTEFPTLPGLPKFPTTFTDDDTARLQDLTNESEKLREIYQSQFAPGVYEKKSAAEKAIRRIGEFLYVPGWFGDRAEAAWRRFTPWLETGVTDVQAEQIIRETQRELSELQRQQTVVQRTSDIVNYLNAMAYGGYLTGDEAQLYELVPELNPSSTTADRLDVTDEERQWFIDYTKQIAGKTPEEIEQIYVQGFAAPESWEDMLGAFKTIYGETISPEQILSTIAFSKDIEEITSALNQAFPPEEEKSFEDVQEDDVKAQLAFLGAEASGDWAKDAQTLENIRQEMQAKFYEEVGRPIILEDKESGASWNVSINDDGIIRDIGTGEVLGKYNEDNEEVLPAIPLTQAEQYFIDYLGLGDRGIYDNVVSSIIPSSLEDLKAKVVASDWSLIEYALKKVYPNQSVEDILRYAGEHPNDFVDDVIDNVTRGSAEQILGLWYSGDKENWDELFNKSDYNEDLLSIEWIIQPEDVGLPNWTYGILGSGKGQARDLITLDIRLDWTEVDEYLVFNSNDLAIFHDGKRIGRIDSDTGNAIFEDEYYLQKAFVPTGIERMRLWSEGQYPTEAFDTVIMRGWSNISRWLYTPKEVGDNTLPAPAQVLGLIGLIGTIAYTGYQGIQALQYMMATSPRLGSFYRVLPGTTAANVPKTIHDTITGKIRGLTVNEIRAYKLYSQTASYENLQTIVNAANIPRDSALYRFTDEFTFRGYQAYQQGNMDVAQNYLSVVKGIYQGWYLPGSPGQAQAFTSEAAQAAAGASEATVAAINQATELIILQGLSASQITPALVQSFIEAGAVLEVTPALTTSLLSMGFTRANIEAMSPDKAWVLYLQGISTPDNVSASIDLKVTNGALTGYQTELKTLRSDADIAYREWQSLQESNASFKAQQAAQNRYFSLQDEISEVEDRIVRLKEQKESMQIVVDKLNNEPVSTSEISSLEETEYLSYIENTLRNQWDMYPETRIDLLSELGVVSQEWATVSWADLPKEIKLALMGGTKSASYPEFSTVAKSEEEVTSLEKKLEEVNSTIDEYTRLLEEREARLAKQEIIGGQTEIAEQQEIVDTLREQLEGFTTKREELKANLDRAKTVMEMAAVTPTAEAGMPEEGVSRRMSWEQLDTIFDKGKEIATMLDLDYVGFSAFKDYEGAYFRDRVTGETFTIKSLDELKTLAKERGFTSDRIAGLLRSGKKGVQGIPTPEVGKQEFLGDDIEVKPSEEDVTVLATYSEGGVPINPDEPIPSTVLDESPIIKDIGIKERVRPSRKVFERIGQYRLWKGIQKAEVEKMEAQAAFRKELRVISKLVDKKRRYLVFRELENPGTQDLIPKEQEAVSFFKQHFDIWADKLDIPAEQRRTNYITHIFEADIKAQLEDKHPLDTSILRSLEYRAAKTIFNPYLQKRLGKETGLIEDPFAAATAYESRALRVFYYQPLLEKVAAIANSPKTPPVVRRYLREYTRRMTGAPAKLDIEANNSLREMASKLEKLPGGKAISDYFQRNNVIGMASNHLANAYYLMWMGFKATSAIRNLGQNTLTIAEVGMKYYADGWKLRGTEEGKRALAKSLVMRGRGKAYIPGIEEPFQAKWSQDFRDTALTMFKAADKGVNVPQAFLAGYSEAKALFPNAGEELWIERGDEVAADTQYLYTALNSMELGRSGLGRVFTVLTTWTENWLELMAKWVGRKPSQAYLEYAKEQGKTLDEILPKKNWSMTRKSILLYLAIVGMALSLKDRDRLKAWEYTGITSLNYLADAISGELPGLEFPSAVADMVTGFILQDDARFKEGWSSLKNTFTPGFVKQWMDVATGERDWLTLWFYLQQPEDIFQATDKIVESLDELKGQLGQSVEGSYYTLGNYLTDFLSKVKEEGIPDWQILDENGGYSDLDRFAYWSVNLWEEYKKLPPNEKKEIYDRLDYRRDNPAVDATLLFWEQVQRARSDEATDILKTYFKTFGYIDENGEILKRVHWSQFPKIPEYAKLIPE